MASLKNANRLPASRHTCCPHPKPKNAVNDVEISRSHSDLTGKCSTLNAWSSGRFRTLRIAREILRCFARNTSCHLQYFTFRHKESTCIHFSDHLSVHFTFKNCLSEHACLTGLGEFQKVDTSYILVQRTSLRKSQDWWTKVVILAIQVTVTVTNYSISKYAKVLLFVRWFTTGRQSYTKPFPVFNI